MKVTIHPGRVKGVIQAPTSKSSMQRACAAALLHRGTTHIVFPGNSNDDRAAIDIIERLGATLHRVDDTLIVKSKGIAPVANEINCGESGLSIRMFTPICALSDQELTITGSGSLVNRPMHFFDEIFPKLGIEIKSSDGFLPLKIKGPLKPVDLEVDGSLSSQFLTGLLMAYSSAISSGSIDTDIEIKVNNLKSKPYIDLTLDVMQQFGMLVPENNNYESFVFRKDKTAVSYGPVEYQVEGDWSGGAFLLVAGAIAGPVTVRGLDVMSTQADKAILDALMRANAAVAVDGKQINVHPAGMQAFEFNATDCPDLFPPLVALASFCKGTTVIRGVSRLAHKESNRGLTLQEEFGKLGVKIDLNDDEMRIEGVTQVNPASVHSRHDHRIAMACAVASLGAGGPVQIEEAQAVNKSYPDFFQHLKKLEAEIEIRLADYRKTVD